MSIIKINHLDGVEIKNIFVFKGSHIVNDDFMDDAGVSIFSDTERVNIEKNSIPVELIDVYIHGDDTVSTIKKNIIQCNKCNSQGEIEEESDDKTIG